MAKPTKKSLALLWTEIRGEVARKGSAIVLANPTDYRDAICMMVLLEDGRALHASTPYTAETIVAGVALAEAILAQARALPTKAGV